MKEGKRRICADPSVGAAGGASGLQACQTSKPAKAPAERRPGRRLQSVSALAGVRPFDIPPVGP